MRLPYFDKHLATFSPRRAIASGFAALAVASTGCASNGGVDLLGYGVDTSQVSETIYQITVRDTAASNVENARMNALLAASQLALDKGYAAFEIIGGEGFKKRTRVLRAGPIPVPLPGEPSGELTVRLLSDASGDNPDVYDAVRTHRTIELRKSRADPEPNT